MLELGHQPPATAPLLQRPRLAESRRAAGTGLRRLRPPTMAWPRPLGDSSSHPQVSSSSTGGGRAVARAVGSGQQGRSLGVSSSSSAWVVQWAGRRPIRQGPLARLWVAPCPSTPCQDSSSRLPAPPPVALHPSRRPTAPPLPHSSPTARHQWARPPPPLHRPWRCVLERRS